MKEFEFEGKWRKFVIEENLKDHVMSFTANAFKIAKEFGVDGDPIVKPGKFGDYTVFFPFDPGPSGAALTALGQRTMTGQKRDASMNKAKQAADKFFEFVMQSGSPVDLGGAGVDEGRTSYMVFLPPA
jgi:hypothetical protein